MHFRKFTEGKCTFGDVSVDLCTRFREYLLTAKQLKHTKKTVSRNTASGYFSTFRALLKQAYKERLITENINDYLEYIEWEDVVREFLAQEELIQLAPPCKHDVLCWASLFSLSHWIAYQRRRESALGQHPVSYRDRLVYRHHNSENQTTSSVEPMCYGCTFPPSKL